MFHALRVDVLLVVVTASYLTLGIFAQDTAESVWAPYTAVVFILALINLGMHLRAERRNERVER